MSDLDPHSPTTAGPEPVGEPVAAEPSAEPTPEPTPVVGAGDATWSQPAGSALLDGAPAGAPADPNPEKRVGAAFGGGLVAALVLRSLAKRKHR
jgi:hypothetical protein